MSPLKRSIALAMCLGLLVAACAQATPTSAPATTKPPPTPTSATTVASPIVEPTAEPVFVPPQGGELVVALAAEPSKIDPHRTATVDAILPIMQACETLLIMQGDGTFVPGLASAWEVSPNGKAYTFELRQGVKFHDGTPFNAEAVKYNFDRIVDPATKSESSINSLSNYLFTEIVDENTARVHLNQPYAPFLDGVSSGYLCMVSPTAAQEWGPEEFQDHFVGTGPFVFKEWKRQEYIRLERNPDYWGGPEFFAHQGPAYLDAIVFRFISEAAVRAGTLETGEVQVVSDVPATEVSRLEANPDILVVSKAPPGTPVLLLFNMSKAPTDDINVRQALEYAIDSSAFSQILYQGVHGPAFGPLTPTSPCYWEGAESLYPYDPEKAKALLEAAGWVDADGDGIREKDGQPLLLDFPTHGGFGRFRDVAPILQAQLAEVGVNLNAMPLAAPAWLEAGRTGNLHIGITQWPNRDPGLNLRIVFNSANATSFAWNWHKNLRLDAQIQQGMEISDQGTRCALYREVQKTVMEDAMTKPLHQWNRVWGVRTEVQGLMLDESFPAVFWAFDAYLDQ